MCTFKLKRFAKSVKKTYHESKSDIEFNKKTVKKEWIWPAQMNEYVFLTMKRVLIAIGLVVGPV